MPLGDWIVLACPACEWVSEPRKTDREVHAQIEYFAHYERAHTPRPIMKTLSLVYDGASDEG